MRKTNRFLEIKFGQNKNKIKIKQVDTHRIGELPWRNNITAEGCMASYNASDYRMYRTPLVTVRNVNFSYMYYALKVYIVVVNQ